jgi:hypothetical protein
MDKFNDMYGGPNYMRLFLLFVLFLVSLFYYMEQEIPQTTYSDTHIYVKNTS